MMFAPKSKRGLPVSAAIVAVFSAFALSSAFSQDPALPEENDDDLMVLEKFEVTGSRIKRIDTETPQPVIAITRADFEATGFTTVGDALRALPMVSGQSLTSIDGGTSFTPGTSSINLRGLGNNNTLVLVNGRRAAPYGSPGFNGFQVVFDFNSIPTAAIESIEILKDGASAIYGSDAVAGVVDIRLRKDFQGLSTELSFGNTFGTDSFESGGFAIFGASTDNTSIVTTLDWSERNAIYARDLWYTAQADGSSVGGFDQRSSANVIANVRGLADRVTFPTGQATFLVPQDSPTIAEATPGNRFYNFQEHAGMFPETRTFGFYTRATHDISDSMNFFGEFSFRRSEVTIDAAPTPLFATNENGDSTFGTIVFPSTNPFNPFGQDITDLRWRMLATGNRVNDITSDVPRILIGLEGRIGEDWTWESGVLYTKVQTTNTNAGTVFDHLLQDAFHGVEIEGQMLYANPFGPNDPRILDYMTGENPQNDSYEIRSYDISASGSLYDMPAGPLGLAFGGEIRTEKIASIGTVANETGDVVGGSEGANTFGSRRVHSLYAELGIPLHSMLEVQLAGRHEDYSDFGKTTKPKVAVKFRPIDQLILRASYGESFLAPNLPFLYTTQSTSFSAQFLADPLRPNDPLNQVRQLGGGNPDLQPEETEVHYAGLVLSPFSKSDGSLIQSLTFSVDYFKFDQENLIDSLDAATILDNLDLFGDLVIRNAPAPGETVGTISSVITTFQNLATARYEGFDFGVSWDHTFANVGRVRANLAATMIDSYLFEGTEFAGTYSQPEWRGTATFAWNRGDWAASMFVTYIGPYDQLFTDGDVNEQWLVNPQIAYSGFMDTTITVGVRNAFDKNPPLDQSDTTLTNPAINNIEPAFWYVRFSKDW
jgi:iron complex outermembrane receptor protein